MKKAWEEFWSDYNEMVLKNSDRWLKKHWKGYTVLCIVSFFIPFIVSFITTLLVKIRKEKLDEKKGEEES